MELQEKKNLRFANKKTEKNGNKKKIGRKKA